MRKSKSLLNNVSNPQGVNPEGYSDYDPHSAVRPHADAIQHRINRNRSLHAHEQQQMFVEDQGYRPVYSDAYYPTSNSSYPPHSMMQPQQVQGAHLATATANHQLDNVKANLEKLSAKLGMIAQAQGDRNRDNTRQDTFEKQLSRVSDAVVDLSSLMSGVQSKLVDPADIHHMRETIDKNYGDILARLDAVGNADIDPSAYARAVETSHANVIEQIRQIEGALEAGLVVPVEFAQSVQTGYAELSRKIEGIAATLTSSDSESLEQIKYQLSGLENVISGFAVRETQSPTPDFSGFEKQLEEVNRAIIAMSSMDNGIDNLDRIEARLKDVASEIETFTTREAEKSVSFDTSGIETQLSDVGEVLGDIQARLAQNENGQSQGYDDLAVEMKNLSRKIDALEAASVVSNETSAPMIDLSAVENRFAETSDVIRELEGRILESFGSKDPEISGLQTEIQRLGDKIDNFAAATFTGGGEEVGNSALLERLDALAAREIPKSTEIDLSVLESRFDETRSALQEIEARVVAQSASIVPDFGEFTSQVQSIGEKVDFISSVAAQSGNETSTDPILLERIDELVRRVELLATPQHDDHASNSSPELLMSLQEQMALLSEQIGNQSSPIEGLEPVTETLSSIQQQLGASRDIGIEMAAGAAEEAVRKVMDELPTRDSGVDPAILSALHQDIQSLQNSMKSGSDSEVPFRELQNTLEAIAERLHSLENGVHEIRMQGSAANIAAMPTSTFTGQDDQAKASPILQSVEGANAVSNPQDDFINEAVEHPQTDLLDEPYPDQEPGDETPSGEVRLPDLATVSNDGAFEAQLDDTKISAGERLVKAARRAEQERQRAKQEYQEEFATTPSTPDYSDSLAAHAHSLAEEQRAAAHELPEVSAPDLSPTQMPETYDMPGDLEPDSIEAEEDAPIEPGAGGPDLVALVKQANERRKTLASREDGASGTDFLAAARKAAQAAALEASVVEAEAEKSKPQKSKGLLGSLPSLLTKRKKAIAIAAAAALLVAIAVPIVSKFAFAPDTTEIAEVQTTSFNEEQIASSVEDIDPSQDRISVVTEFTPDEAENPFPSSQVQEELTLASTFEVSEEQTAAIPTSQPLPFDIAEIGFASDALKSAVELNDAAAIFEIGRRYTNGIGTEKNLKEAAKWYEHAANLDYVPAQYIIGNFNEKGVGIKADRTLAEAWYEQAAESGHVVAMHNLAVMNASPDPVTGKANLKKSFKWFSKAAEHGVRDSQVNMGILLAKGIGAEVDLVESYKWLALAAKSGDTDAEQKRNFIADAMRPDQLEEARTRIENWKQFEPDATANTIVVPDSWKSADDKLAVLTDQNTVAQAQTLLTKLGFDAGPSDGVMGKKTREAIAAFRAKSGLSVSDRLDLEFMEALRAVSI